MDEDGAIRRFVNLYVNGEDVRYLRALETEVRQDDQVAIRVHAPAESGRATEEARRALASALGIPPSWVALRSGARSRRKVFEVQGMASGDVLRRLGGV